MPNRGNPEAFSFRAYNNHGPVAPGANGRPVRALIVDDSAFVLKTITSLLDQQSKVQQIGLATDGYAAVRRAKELSPG
jgi:two-component system, chemotaxis family, protein-glutamate methylesterase/glutaminase